MIPTLYWKILYVAMDCGVRPNLDRQFGMLTLEHKGDTHPTACCFDVSTSPVVDVVNLSAKCRGMVLFGKKFLWSAAESGVVWKSLLETV